MPAERRATRPRGCLFAAARLALLSLLLLGAVVLFIGLLPRAPWFRELARRELCRLASDTLGADLFVAELEVIELFPLTLSARDAVLTARGGDSDGMPLVAFDALDVALGPPDLDARILPIASVVLSSPRGRVALDRGRLRDFADIIDRLKPKRRPERPIRVDVQRVVIDDLAVRTSVEPLGLGAAARGVFLDFDRAVSTPRGGGGPGGAPGALRVDDIEVVIGALREHAELREGTFDVDDGWLAFRDYVLQLRTGPVALEGRVPLRSGRDRAFQVRARAELDLPRLREAFPKVPLIDGRAEVQVGATGHGGHPQIDFDVAGSGIAVHAGKKRPLLFKVGDVSLRGFVIDDLLRVARSSVAWGGGRVGIDGEMTLSGELPWKADLRADGLDLARILDAVTVPHAWVRMQIDGDIAIAGKLRDRRRGLVGEGWGDLAVRELIVEDGPSDGPTPRTRMLRVPTAHVRTGIRLDKRACRLVDARVTGPGSAIVVDTDFLFQKPLGLRIHVRGDRLALRDLDSMIASQPVDGVGAVDATIAGPSNNLRIDGRLDIDGFVFRGWPFGRVEGVVAWQARSDLHFTELVGRRGESRFRADTHVLFANKRRGGPRERLEIEVNATVAEGEGRAEDLLPIFFSDKVKATGSASGSARLFGPPGALMGDGQVEVRGARYLWEEFDSVSVRAAVDRGSLVIREGFARKASGAALWARGTISKGGGVDVEFRLPGMDASDLTSIRGSTLPLHGRLSGSAVLLGDLRAVSVDARLRLREAFWREDALGDSEIRVTVRDHVARARGSLLDGAVTAMAELTLEGLWPYSFGLRAPSLPIDPWLPRTVLGRSQPVHASIGGELTGTGTLRDAWHEIALTLPRFLLERGAHRIEAGRPLRVALQRGALVLEDVELTGPERRTDLRVEGFVRPNGPLDLTAAGFVDVAFADLFADVFERAEAKSLHVDTLRFSGTTQSLDIEGRAELKEALLKTLWFPHALEVDRAVVSFRERTLRLDTLDARLGGGQLKRAEGSTIRFDRSGFRPRQYDLRVECVDCTVRYPSFLPPARGSALLAFSGIAPDSLMLSGRVDVAEMVLRDTMNWQRSVLTFREKATSNLSSEERKALFGFDIDVRSSASALRIANNLGDLRGTASGLRITGDTSDVLLTGTVRIDSGTFRFKGHDFNLEPGTAEFRDRESWFPFIEIEMWSDVTAAVGEDYRVGYAVSGPLDNPTLYASAEPYLSEADINSLLVLGLTQEQLERADVADLGAAALAAAAGTYTETAAASFGQVAAEGRAVLPDRVEIVPVYTESTGATTFWAVLTKEVIPDRLLLEGGLGLGGGRSAAYSGRARLRFLRGLYLEGSWVRDERSTRDYGNFGLEMKAEIEFD